MVNSNIANFFAILLQYNSKHRIVLFTNCKKNNNILFSIYPGFSLSSLSFFCALLTLPSLSPSALSSLKLHHQNFSPISEISHPSHTATLSSLIARPLSHLSSHGFSLLAPVLDFGFLRLEVGSTWIGKLGLDHWAGIG